MSFSNGLGELGLGEMGGHLLPPPRREAAHLKPARGSGERCKLPQRGPGCSRILLHCMFAKRIWLQHFWFFGQHCNKWQNDLYGIFMVQNGSPLKSAAPVRLNTSNMPEAGLKDLYIMSTMM